MNKISLKTLLLVLLIHKSNTSCTIFKICHSINADKTNVHIIPYTHLESGWLKTIDEYYYGANDAPSIQSIFSSVIQSLIIDKDRRFIISQIYYFSRWYNAQNDFVKSQVSELINNGSLEFVNGAWSNNDEATANYHSIIDQYSLGLRFLNDTFGECAMPKVGWLIGSKGHSKCQAFIAKAIGFQGIIIDNIDYRDHKQRVDEKNLDFLWKISDNSTLFSSVLPIINFDFSIFQDPIIDDPDSPLDNISDKTKAFVAILMEIENSYKTPNILLPIGTQFAYQSAEQIFLNLDKIIKYMKSDETFSPLYNIIYSTPSCYIQAVNQTAHERNLTLSDKHGDFFPFASDDNSYWTGFYSTRPTLKRIERFTSNVLNGAKQLLAFAKATDIDKSSAIDKLQNILAIIQHHNAITGTAMQHVVDDYKRMIFEAIAVAQEPLGAIIGKFLAKDPISDASLNLTLCLLSNISICDNSIKDKFLVIAYNPLSRYVDNYIRLPVQKAEYRIIGAEGEEDYDIFDGISNFAWVDYQDSVPSSYELVFLAKKLPPLGLKLYYIEKVGWSEASHYRRRDNSITNYGNEVNGFLVKDNILRKIRLRGVEYEIEHNFAYYPENPHRSNPYVFSTYQNESESYNEIFNIVSFGSIGSLLDEFIQIYHTNDCKLRQIIRVYKDNSFSFIEFDWLIGDLTLGRELISRFRVKNFQSSDNFFTDSNGRELMQRERDKRDFNYEPKGEFVSSNFYPVTSRIVSRDILNRTEVGIICDRSQGGSVRQHNKDAMIELLIHRRLQNGLFEELDETEFGRGVYVRGKHWLVMGNTDSTDFETILTHNQNSAPLIFLADATTSDHLNTSAAVDSFLSYEFSGLVAALPDNVKILTLEPWTDDNLLLRLEHIFEKNDDDLSQHGKIMIASISQIFSLFQLEHIRETTLGANQFLEELSNDESIDWDAFSSRKFNFSGSVENVLMEPFQIRTFIMKIKRSGSTATTSIIDNSFDQVLRSNPMNVFVLLCLFIIIW